eukprot:Hpha_TRINITY_DN5473_c0_g1::TRINITY_DN5473_c0_g1_i1::g.192511::m.192511
MAGLDIFARVDGQLIPVTCEIDDTCGKLAERLEEQIGTHPTLIYQGRTLPPDALLADEGVCPQSVVEAILGLVFRHESPFDTNGLLYYMGTLGLTEPYKNPHTRRLVTCTKEPDWISTQGKAALYFAGRQGVYCRTNFVLDPYFQIDLKVAAITPTHYSLKHGRDQKTHVLRSWKLEASHDGEAWDTIDTRTDDATLKDGTQGGVEPFSHGTWQLEEGNVNGRYRFFRVLGKRNWEKDRGFAEPGGLYLHLSGFEVYGTATFQDDWQGSAADPTEEKPALFEWLEAFKKSSLPKGGPCPSFTSPQRCADPFQGTGFGGFPAAAPPEPPSEAEGGRG